MAGSTIGGKKTALKVIASYGEDYYKRIGSIGGRAKVPKGFALNPELASKAGTIGGRNSKRKKVNNDVQNVNQAVDITA